MTLVAGKTRTLKSIIVYTTKMMYHDSSIEQFMKTSKGRWVKNNAVSIEKLLTYTPDGDMMINVRVLFTEEKLIFYILKWK